MGPPHALGHVVPAAQVADCFPLHVIVQAVPAPHSTVQPVLPPHSAVQPPFGHLMLQVLLPSQKSDEPVSSVTVQELPPPQVTLLFTPVTRLHVLVPVHVEVQLDSQLPSQMDWPPQLVVQPVPQVESHVFFDSHLYETLSGGGVAVPVPPSPEVVVDPPPNSHVPPCLHVQVVPVHSQSPVQDATAGPISASSLPQPTNAPAPIASAPIQPRTKERSRMRIGASVINVLGNQASSPQA